jgi:hypothetical protein
VYLLEVLAPGAQRSVPIAGGRVTVTLRTADDLLDREDAERERAVLEQVIARRLEAPDASLGQGGRGSTSTRGARLVDMAWQESAGQRPVVPLYWGSLPHSLTARSPDRGSWANAG